MNSRRCVHAETCIGGSKLPSSLFYLSVHEVGHERWDVLDLNRNWRRCDDDQLGLMRLHEQKSSLHDLPFAWRGLQCHTGTSVLRFNMLREDAESFTLCTVCYGRAACHLCLYDHTLDFSRTLVLIRPTGMVLVGPPYPRACRHLPNTTNIM